MRETATSTIDATIYAWDLYCNGSYEKLVQEFREHESEELRDMSDLALLEMDSATEVSAKKDGLFSPLTAGMSAFHRGDYRLSSTALGSWLLNKNYFSKMILQRFVHSARESENHSLLFTVAKKFIDRKNYQEDMAEPLFLSAFQLERHKDAVAIFEKFREYLNDSATLQRVAFSLMQTGRYADAERILISLYEKITGAAYQLNYETVRERYRETIENIPFLENVKDRSYDESMQLGMAYLFSNRYEDALRIFTGLTRA